MGGGEKGGLGAVGRWHTTGWKSVEGEGKVEGEGWRGVEFGEEERRAIGGEV